MLEESFFKERFNIDKWINIQKFNFKWPVAKEGYKISNESSLTPKFENPTFKIGRLLDLQGKQFLFKHFCDIDVGDRESIVGFTNDFGLLIGPEYIVHEQRKEVSSIPIDFFIREVRDFQEIFSLRELLSQSEGELYQSRSRSNAKSQFENHSRTRKSKKPSASVLIKDHLDNYFEKRFKCDNNNFDSFGKHLSRMEFSSHADPNDLKIADYPWLGNEESIRRLEAIHNVYYDAHGFPEESEIVALREKLNIKEDDPYYLNKDISEFRKQNANYPPSDDIITDLDFMDYPQKRSELKTEDLGYYYLEKWIDFKLNRKLELKHYRPISQIVSSDTKVTKNTHQPQSLLEAIYLQFYYSLYGNRFAAFCPICLEYAIRKYNVNENKGFTWHRFCNSVNFAFHYHQHCIDRIEARIKSQEAKKKKEDEKEEEQKPSPLKTIMRAKEMECLENDFETTKQALELIKKSPQLIRKILRFIRKIFATSPSSYHNNR